MKEKASAILIRIAEVNPGGISLAEAGRIPIRDDVRDAVLTCLYDTDPEEVRWGIWFAHGLQVAQRTDSAVTAALLERLPRLMEFNDQNVRKEALPVLILLRERMPGYRELMVRSLDDQDREVRCMTLRSSSTFLRAREVEPLLRFQTDQDTVELAMGGPLSYWLRNEALSQIEGLLARDFQGSVLSERAENGSLVTWRDWSPFLAWWNSPWKRLVRRLTNRKTQHTTPGLSPKGSAR